MGWHMSEVQRFLIRGHIIYIIFLVICAVITFCYYRYNSKKLRKRKRKEVDKFLSQVDKSIYYERYYYLEAIEVLETEITNVILEFLNNNGENLYTNITWLTKNEISFLFRQYGNLGEKYENFYKLIVELDEKWCGPEIYLTIRQERVTPHRDRIDELIKGKKEALDKFKSTL